MLFWIASAFFTFLAILSVVLPMRDSRLQSSEAAISYDKEIYKSRMTEITRDLELGRISSVEAKAAEAEEGRRLLALSQTADGASVTAGPSSAVKRTIVGLCLLFIPVFTMGGYLLKGRPDYQDMPLAERKQENPETLPIEQLIARVETELSKNPEDIRGWRAVMPIYIRLQRFGDAATAMRNILRLGGPDAEIQAMLGETITTLQEGIVTDEARRLFEAATKAAPQEIMPKFYLAIAMGQEGKYKEAAKSWKALLVNAPSDAQWAAVARSQLAEMESRLNPQSSSQSNATDNDSSGVTGPTQSDIEASKTMSAADRMAMIEGMVEQLSDKLKDDPQNAQGWRRLVQSYIVLGKINAAKTAISDAKSALPNDKGLVAELDELATKLPAEEKN